MIKVNEVRGESVSRLACQLNVMSCCYCEGRLHNNDVCSYVREYVKSQWPDKNKIDCSLKPYWKARGSLTICKGILSIKALRKDVMMRIHEGHYSGLERCRMQVRQSVWWSGVISQVQE